MSFGASLKFQTTSGNGRKPAIFWQQETEAKPKRKFSYKSKQNPVPLRSKVAQQQHATQEATNLENKNHRKELGSANKQRVGSSAEQSNKKSKHVIQPNREAGKRHYGSNSLSPSTVTLTQEQLNSILAAIGHTQSSSNVKLDFDKETQELKVIQDKDNEDSNKDDAENGNESSKDPEKSEEKNNTDDAGEESILNLIKSKNKTKQTVTKTDKENNNSNAEHNNNKKKVKKAGQDENKSNYTESKSDNSNSKKEKVSSGKSRENSTVSKAEKQVEDSSSQAEKEEDKKESDIIEKASSTPVANTPKLPLSKAELKRLQWEKERAEQNADYNPWGRPGAGAPVRSTSGKILADYKSRMEQSLKASWEAQEFRKHKESGRNSVAPTPKPVPQENITTPRQSNVPHAMRTSVAFGSPADDQYSKSNKDEKKQWLEELEKQREEKRMQKQQEKENRNQEPADRWADKLSSANVPQISHRGPAPTANSSQAVDTIQEVTTPRVNSAPITTEGKDDEQVTSHLRGQNFLMDEYTRMQMEEKKRRHLEHQLAIKAQVEEKERLKREEREMKQQEEMEEERKVKTEQDLMKLEFQLEEEKKKKREQKDEARVLALKAQFDAAQQQALIEKHNRRIQKLQQGGHDVHNLQTHYEAQTARSVHPPQQAMIDSHGSGRDTNQGDGVVAPVNVPGLDLTGITSHRDSVRNSVQPQGIILSPTGQAYSIMQQTPKGPAQLVVHQPYTEDRVLTPSRFRPNPIAREFSTQTEGLITLPTDATVIEIEYKHKEFNKPTKQNTRKGHKVQSKDTVNGRPKANSAGESRSKADNTTDVKRRGPLKISDRPSWGAKVTKKVKSQSERDPNYERRKQASEARKEKRKQELLGMVEANSKIGQHTRQVKARVESPPVPTHRSNAADQDRDSYRERNKSPPATNRKNAPSQHRATHEVHVDDYQRNSPPIPTMRTARDSTREEKYVGQGQRQDRYVGQVVRSHSPPVPALRNKMQAESDASPRNKHESRASHHDSPRNGKVSASDFQNDYDLDSHNYHNYRSHKAAAQKEEDRARKSTDDFVPFMRTSEVLDPAHAEDPMAVLREGTNEIHARRVHLEQHRPAEFGNRMDNYDDLRIDKHRLRTLREESKDPIINPSLVTEHPTQRQNILLQQLSSLRQNLIHKQREIESMVSPSELTADRSHDVIFDSEDY